MVKVYFENLGSNGVPNYAELIAILDNEETYHKLLPVFEKMAEDAGMIVTESIDDEFHINEL